MLSANTMTKSKVLRLDSAYTLSPENTCNTRVFERRIQHRRNGTIGLTCYPNKLQLRKYISNPEGPHTAGLIDVHQDAALGHSSLES
jgi:hypothetical protein